MVEWTYKQTIDHIISVYEGSYCWDSGDPGGPTKYGITCYDLAEHRHQHMNSMSRWAPLVRAMPLSEAEEIYVQKYAITLCYNQLNAGCDAVMLDYGINSGIVRPVHVAQALFGLPLNNIFHTDLLNRINAANSVWFINRMCDERLRFLQGLRTWHLFHGGWSSRVWDLRRWCTRLAAEKAPQPSPIAPPHPAPPTQPTQAPPPQAITTPSPEIVDLDIDGAPASKGITHPEMLNKESWIMHPVHFLEEEMQHVKQEVEQLEKKL